MGNHVISSTQYKNGQRNGQYIEYYNDTSISQIGAIMDYKNDLRDGICIVWYPNGQIRKEEHWSKGRQFGEQKYYYPNGKLERYIVANKKKWAINKCWDNSGKPKKCPNYLFE